MDKDLFLESSKSSFAFSSSKTNSPKSKEDSSKIPKEAEVKSDAKISSNLSDSPNAFQIPLVFSIPQTASDAHQNPKFFQNHYKSKDSGGSSGGLSKKLSPSYNSRSKVNGISNNYTETEEEPNGADKSYISENNTLSNKSSSQNFDFNEFKKISQSHISCAPFHTIKEMSKEEEFEEETTSPKGGDKSDGSDGLKIRKKKKMASNGIHMSKQLLAQINKTSSIKSTNSENLDVAKISKIASHFETKDTQIEGYKSAKKELEEKDEETEENEENEGNEEEDSGGESIDQLNDNEEVVKEIKEAFNAFDKDCDGFITIAELGTVMRTLGQNPTKEELDEIIKEFDKDESGTIDLNEFMELMKNKLKEQREGQELIETFKIFDKDADGLINAEDIRYILNKVGETLEEELIEALINKGDKDKDGKISYPEFKMVMMNKIK